MTWERWLEQHQQLRDKKAAEAVLTNSSKPSVAPGKEQTPFELLIANIGSPIRRDLRDIGKLQWRVEPEILFDEGYDQQGDHYKNHPPMWAARADKKNELYLVYIPIFSEFAS